MRLQEESRMLSTPDFTLHPWRTEWMGVLLWCIITIKLIIIFLHIIPAVDFRVQVEEKASMCLVHLYFTIPIRWDHLKTVWHLTCWSNNTPKGRSRVTHPDIWWRLGGGGRKLHHVTPDVNRQLPRGWGTPHQTRFRSTGNCRQMLTNYTQITNKEFKLIQGTFPQVAEPFFCCCQKHRCWNLWAGGSWKWTRNVLNVQSRRDREQLCCSICRTRRQTSSDGQFSSKDHRWEPADVHGWRTRGASGLCQGNHGNHLTKLWPWTADSSQSRWS